MNATSCNSLRGGMAQDNLAPHSDRDLHIGSHGHSSTKRQEPAVNSPSFGRPSECSWQIESRNKRGRFPHRAFLPRGRTVLAAWTLEFMRIAGQIFWRAGCEESGLAQRLTDADHREHALLESGNVGSALGHCRSSTDIRSGLCNAETDSLVTK